VRDAVNASGSGGLVKGVWPLGLAVALVGCPRSSPPPAFAPPPPGYSPAPTQQTRPVEVAPGPPDHTDAGIATEEERRRLPTSPPLCAKADCGPAPAYPTGSCPDGEHRRLNGPCSARADGSCRWTHTVCPGEGDRCNPSECGSPPVYQRWLCPDGVHVGELGPCVRNRGGRCGLVWRPCRGEGRSLPPPASPPTPPPAATPPPEFFDCDPLPPDRELRTWPIQSICPPGGGPRPPPRRKIKSLGDGTHIFEGRQGCFRARFRECHSK
jgi:hypothetical protein